MLLKEVGLEIQIDFVFSIFFLIDFIYYFLIIFFKTILFIIYYFARSPRPSVPPCECVELLLVVVVVVVVVVEISPPALSPIFIYARYR